MTAHSHPEYTLEHTHLQRTLTIVDVKAGQLVASIRVPTEEWRRDDEALQVRRGIYPQLQAQMAAMQASPYFGRIDFAQTNGQAETWYLGEYLLEEGGVTVLSWQAPIAALFYRSPSPLVTYQSPHGTIRGQLKLKRRLVIQQRALQDVRDEWDTRSQPGPGMQTPVPGQSVPDSATPKVVDPDEFLRLVLSGQASAKLKQIVASIQAEQYALIESDPDQVLIVQGVAGSGKTSIALHRLSYLLYPGNAQHIRAERCIIFGPNRLFLNYTSGILPRLSIDRIQQTTPALWACERIQIMLDSVRQEHSQMRNRSDAEPIKLHLVDVTLDTILDAAVSRDRKRALYLASRLKSSPRMAELLDRYIEHLRNHVQIPREGWSFENVGIFNLNFRVTYDQLAAAFRQYRSRPLMQHRQQFKEACEGLVEDAYYQTLRHMVETIAQPGHQLLVEARQLEEEAARLETAPRPSARQDDGSAAATLRQQAVRLRDQGNLILQQAKDREAIAGDDNRRKVLESLKQMTRRRWYNAWPPFAPLTTYQHLLTDRNLLTLLSTDLWGDTELDLLTMPISRATDSIIIDASDLPALHYLCCVVDPSTTRSYDHVVIDEAQDISELEYLTFQRFFIRGNSCTILGDLPQSIYSHRGISSWNHVQHIFPSESQIYCELQRGYRTTYEIMQLAVRVLNNLSQKRTGIPQAKPFDRHGAPVTLQRVANDTDLTRNIEIAIKQAQSRGHRNIAVIGKTTTRCQSLHTSCMQHIQQPIQLAESADFDYQGGLVLLPIHLAKGVEFDVAIVIDADDQTYTDTEFDGRLLYVAVTRPMHELYIFWQGSRSMYLEQVDGVPL